MKKNIMYVLIANIISLLINLAVGFLQPKLLSIETYASLKLFLLYASYIGVLALGYADGMHLRIGGKSEKDLDKDEILEEYNTFQFFQFLVFIISLILSFLLKNEMIMFCALALLPINFANYLKLFYQAIGQFKKYSKFIVLNICLIFIANLFLLLVLKTDYYRYYIYAYLFVYFIDWLVFEVRIRKMLGYKKTKINFYHMFNDIRIGFFLMIGNFCNIIFTSIDRFFVDKLLGVINFAHYSFAVNVENLMNVFITPVTTVLFNYFCNNKDIDRVLLIKRYILLCSSLIVLMIFPVKFIIELWIEKYEPAISVMFILFAAQYISIMVRCAHLNLYKAHQKQKKYFYKMICVVCLSFILNILAYFICPKMESFAIATLVTNITWFILGEFDFKEYSLKLSDYLFAFFAMFIFLICGLLMPSIVGMFTYFVFILILMSIFERKTIEHAYLEIKRIIVKILKRDIN